MKKSKKYYLVAALAAVNLPLILSACSSGGDSQTAATDSSNQDDKQLSQSPATKTLKIDGQRCVGCGRCTRIDQEHFSLNKQSHQAEVVSQENLDSDILETAIAACPAKAISS
jgi:ferredoxin